MYIVRLTLLGTWQRLCLVGLLRLCPGCLLLFIFHLSLWISFRFRSLGLVLLGRALLVPGRRMHGSLLGSLGARLVFHIAVNPLLSLVQFLV